MAVYRYGKKTSDINVQSDFSVKNVNDDAYIKNRPDSTLSISLDGVKQEKKYNPNTGDETINIDLTDVIEGQDNKLESKIESLQVPSIGGGDSYISQISENDGKISATAIKTSSTIVNDSKVAVNSIAVSSAISTEVTNRNTAISTAINNLDVAEVGKSGSYIKTIKESNGVITATSQAFDTNLSNTSTDLNAPSSKAVYNAIQALGNVYRIKDSVETFSKLPSTNNTAGDVRNVNDTSDNYVWTGSKWDPLGGSNLIDALNTNSPTASGSSTSFITSVSQTKGLVSATKANLPTSSTTVAGIVKLNDTVNSTSTTVAATANAVKKVQDALNTEITNRKNAISALDATVSGTPGAGKTLTAFSETDGKVSAIFGDIAITQSQVSGLVSSLAGKSDKSHTHDDRYYTETEIDTKLAGKANSSHTHNYLPLSGGAMTGNIKYKGSQNTYDMIKFIDNTDDVYGNGIAIGGGGLTIIGGGESADVVAAQESSGGNEKMIIANDAAIDFYTNTQSGFSSAKHITMNTDGTITADGFNGKASTAETADKANGIVPKYTAKTLTTVSATTTKYIKLADCTWSQAGTLQVLLAGNGLQDTLIINFGGGNATKPMLCGHYTGNSNYVKSVIAQKGSAWNSNYSIWIKITQLTTCTVSVAVLTGSCTVNISETTTTPTNTFEWIIGTGVFGTFYGNLTGNSDTATKATQDASGNVITDTYATKTALSSGLSGKSDAGHKHSASDITSGTLSVARGGTGQTTLNASANSLINSLTTGSSAPTDNDYYVAQYAGGGTTTTTYHRRPISALWTYIKDKIETIRLSHSKGITISNTTDVTLSSFGTEGLSIGTPTGINIGIDNNEIQARNNGAASSLYINGNGGTVYFGVGDKYYISSDGSSYNGTAAKATADGSGNNIVNTYAIKNHTHESLKRTQIASGTDLNTLTTPGEYYAIDNKSYPNAPCTNFTMQSIQLMSSYTFQILYAYSSNRIYTRSKIWGGNEHQWTDWKEHAHKDDLDKRKTLSTSTTLSNLVDNMVYYIDTAGIKITLDSSSIAGLNITFVSNKNSTIVYNSPNGSSVTKTMDVGTVLSLYSCGLGYTPNLYGTVLDINPSSTSVGQIYIKTK